MSLKVIKKKTFAHPQTLTTRNGHLCDHRPICCNSPVPQLILMPHCRKSEPNLQIHLPPQLTQPAGLDAFAEHFGLPEPHSLTGSHGCHRSLADVAALFSLAGHHSIHLAVAGPFLTLNFSIIIFLILIHLCSQMHL